MASEKEVMRRVMGSLSITLGSVLAAKRRLGEATAFTNGHRNKKFSEAEALVNRCFKIRDASDAVMAMRKLTRIYDFMPKVIHQAKALFHPISDADCVAVHGSIANAFTFNGAFHGLATARRKNAPRVALRAIYYCTSQLGSKSPQRLADLNVHEMAHFVGPPKGQPGSIGHAAGGGRRALNGTHQQMMITAANYAWLAWLARLPRSEWMTNRG